MDFSSVRILEIGDKPYIKGALPQQTTYFSTYAADEGIDAEQGRYSVKLRTLPALWRALHDPGYAIIVCQPKFYAPWHWQSVYRSLFHRRIFQGHLPLVRVFGSQFLRAPVGAPIAILDHEDLPVINRNNFFLLDRCHTYFKRELPVDRWRLFFKTAHANLPTARFRRQKLYNERLSKVYPISLGFPPTWSARTPAPAADKTVDIFFAGKIEASSSIRPRGVEELTALRAQGVNVDISEHSLPLDEFYRRCARAWLVWSPEGYGWDCFRHYEALGCGSVPMINQPTIERHQPLIEGEHALYYDVEPGGLTRAVTAALADKPRLTRIAQAGRTHALAHHTPQALARHIVETTLALTGVRAS